MTLLQGQKFLFKCSECEYHAPIKGYWAVITRYPDESLYSLLCVTCDAKNSIRER